MKNEKFKAFMEAYDSQDIELLNHCRNLNVTSLYSDARSGKYGSLNFF